MSQRNPLSPERARRAAAAGALAPAAHRSRYYWMVTIPASAIPAAALYALDFPFVTSWLAFVLFSVCFFPTYEYARWNRREVPVVPVLAGAFALQFFLPVFTSDRRLLLADGPYEVPLAALNFALVLAILAAAVFIGITRSAVANRAITALPVLRLHFTHSRAMLFCLAFGTLAIVTSLLFPGADSVGGGLGALARVVRNQALVVVGILAWLTYDIKSLWMKILWYAVIVTMVVVGLASGFLEAAVAPLGVMFICEWVYYRRINKTVLLLAACMVVFLNPVKDQIRMITWHGAGVDMTRIEKTALWIERATGYWLNVVESHAGGGGGVRTVVLRTNLIDLLGLVIDETPERTPYLYGETYAFFAYFMIPRILWPGKPVASANTVLGVRYRLTSPEVAEEATLGLGLLSEGYANFGAFGVLFISGVLGVVLLTMLRLFGHAESGPGGAAILISFFIYFLNGLGSSAEILFGNVIQSMLASYVLLYWFAEKRPRFAGAAGVR